MSDEKNDWKDVITVNRYVAYIDIMGFKAMVARQSHDEIYAMMKQINRSIDFFVNTNFVKANLYSDSIMIYSKDDSLKSLESFIGAVHAITFAMFISKPPIPHKGAIAFGKMTLDIDKSIFFGQPLIDAYLLHDEFHFYGVVAHHTAKQEIDKGNKGEIYGIMEYLCPFKNGKQNHLTIYPAHTALLQNISPELPMTVSMRDSFIRQQQMIFESIKELRNKTPEHLVKYIDNTEEYLNYVKKKSEKETDSPQ